MKLIISSEGPNPSDRVDPRFGRARYLLQYDTDSKTYIALDNTPQMEATQGAGVQAAQKVVEQGADSLLTGHCGPKAYQVLSQAKVLIYSGFEGTVETAVQAWQQGELQPLAAPDSMGHH